LLLTETVTHNQEIGIRKQESRAYASHIPWRVPKTLVHGAARAMACLDPDPGCQGASYTQVHAKSASYGTQLMPAVSTMNLEFRILQLYIWTLAAPKWANLRQSVLLARHGAYEVRLFDPNRDLRSESIPFWLELFDHRNGASLDSYGGYDLQETAAVAEKLICQAKHLHRAATRPGPQPVPVAN
jgi:hypothetical protein